MNFRKIIAGFLLIYSIEAYKSGEVGASDENQFVTIVNPVRISTYSKDTGLNIKTQYKVVSERNLPATWLLTYDSIIDEKVLSIVKNFGEDQEIGIFLEVTPKLAEMAQVNYNDTGSWHHATSIFLSGYTQEERKKMLDAIFGTFKENFGYYPTSVGSWWSDSFSLSYMKERYGITANLGVADQFSTDGYQVWGTYWSTPYYPSLYHGGIPASDKSVKIDVVTIQWAPKEPLNGYFNSYFSTQDYQQSPVSQNTAYFENLVSFYSTKNLNEFAQVTVGLEADLAPESYEGEFANQLDFVQKLKQEGLVDVTTMQTFSKWYREKFRDLTPVHVLEADDFLNTLGKVIWYQSPKLRVGLRYNKETKETVIFDFRYYTENFQEPYFISPNKEFQLYINTPSIFDEINEKENVWKFDLGSLEEIENKGGKVNLVFKKGSVTFTEDLVSVDKAGIAIPKALTGNPNLEIKSTPTKIDIFPKEDWVVSKEGYLLRDLTEAATHRLSSKRFITAAMAVFLMLIFTMILIIRSKEPFWKKIALLTPGIFISLSFICLWYYRNSSIYYVSQDEIEALIKLSSQDAGRVLVYGNECLGCSWHTEYKPAVFANKRRYIEMWGKHEVVYNSSVFEAKNQKEAKEEFDKLNIKYIYVSKYEDYIEKTPFSPGDLGIEKIYGNANAEVWMTKN